jgi:hypothetical protein
MRLAFDSGGAVEHSRRLVIGFRRISAVLLSLTLVAGNAAVCAGWAATPAERMACCAGGGDCPMHKGSDESASEHGHTQAQADTCCASSEREQSNPSNPAALATISPAVLGAGVVLPAIAPLLMVTDGWRTHSPSHSPPVPRHLLLSVFLV